jgi:hypothetical protein
VEYLCELQRNYKFHLTMSVADLHFHPNVLQGKARNKAIESLSKALVILDAPDISADGIKSQLISVKTILENSEPDDKWEDFVNYTMDIDTARNQNFENVFGLKLSNSQNT